MRPVNRGDGVSLFNNEIRHPVEPVRKVVRGGGVLRVTETERFGESPAVVCILRIGVAVCVGFGLTAVGQQCRENRTTVKAAGGRDGDGFRRKILDI